MPAKKPVELFGVDFKDEPAQKVPTYNQFLKRVGRENATGLYLVNLIWLPGQFDNFTLQTDEFRLIVRSGTKLYAALSNRLDEWSKGNASMSIDIPEGGNGMYRFVETQDAGEWFFVGDGSGLRYTARNES